MALQKPIFSEVLQKYKCEDATKKDITNLFCTFKDLRPSVDMYTGNDGMSKELITLAGTIPVPYKEKTYDMPICIWIPEKYPHVAPIVFLKPTSTMTLKRGDNVDANGMVTVQYLECWKYPQSDLLCLVQVMVTAFSENPPLFSTTSKTREPYSKIRTQCKDMGYSYPDIAAKDISIALKQFKELVLKQDSFVFNDGSRKELLKLDGFVQISYKGEVYHTPLCVWILNLHPYVSPMVFLNPTRKMVINQRTEIDGDGRVNISYLQNWRQPTSSLLCLLHELVINFSSRPPLVKRTEQINPEDADTL